MEPYYFRSISSDCEGTVHGLRVVSNYFTQGDESMNALTLQGYKRVFDLSAGSGAWGEYGRDLPPFPYGVLRPFLLQECKWTASYEISIK